MLYIIIVLYKTKLEDSLTFKALKKNLSLLKDLGSKILIYNNSPEIEIPLSEDYIVHTPSKNLMLAGAYNYALEQANNEGYKWLLLLDQDTELTEDYVRELISFISSSKSENYDVALPILKKEDIYLSPESYNKNVGPYWESNKIKSNDDLKNLGNKDILVAYNSAALLKVSTLTKINGFDMNYPLDMLDHRYFYQLNQINAKFYILPTVFEQNLSLLDKKNPMSIPRYLGYISACHQYAKQLGFVTLLSYKLRLCLHICSQIIRPYKRQYIKYTLKQLFFKW